MGGTIVKVRIRQFRTHAAIFVASVALIGATAACEESTTTDTDSGSKDSVSAGKESGKSDDAKPKGDTPKSAVEEFTAYVNANGTGPEKDAAKHVTKILGADEGNDILDTAEIHTDYTGSIMDLDSGVSGSGKLLASSFAEWQKSRGNDSKNGLVSVYNASGDLISNGQY